MAEQYGSRLKLGVVTPGTNTTLEPDCHALCPVGVTAHTARIPIQNKKISGDAAYAEHVKAMREGIGSAILQVASSAPDQLIMGVALEAFWGGLAGTRQLQSDLHDLAEIDVTLGSLAMHKALQAVGAKRIAVLTPHMPAGDEQVRHWFEEAGYDITGFLGLRCSTPRAIADVPLEELRAAITTLNNNETDAIVQVGTNLQFRRFALAAETALGKPVLALNSVMMWDALRARGLDDQLADAGVLFEHH